MEMEIHSIKQMEIFFYNIHVIKHKMSSNIAKVIHEPQPKKWHCRDRLNAEIDDKCLILLGSVPFHNYTWYNG